MDRAYEVRYRNEQLPKVKRLGGVAAVVALLSIPIFYYLDLEELKIVGSWPWRLVGFLGGLSFIVALLLRLPVRPMMRVHAISLGGYLLMMLGLSLQVFADGGYGQPQYFAVTIGVLTVSVVITFVAKGVERYMFLGMGISVAVYLIFLFLYRPPYVGYIACIIIVGLFSMLLLRNQFRQSREKAYYLYKLEEREQEMEQQREALEEANANLVGFNYAITHDLKGPLRRIQSFAQLIERRVRPEAGSELDEFFGHIQNDTANIMEIIEGLLLLSHVGKAAMQYQFLDLTALTQKVWSEVEPRELAQKANLELQPLGKVYADPNLVWHVLTNFLSNAIKYSQHEEKPVVEVGCYNEQDERILYVKDNGAGFPAPYAKELGRPFTRLHSAHEFEGTGIGLAIVRQVAELHGGRFWAEGQEGVGATFYFSFPNKVE